MGECKPWLKARKWGGLVSKLKRGVELGFMLKTNWRGGSFVLPFFLGYLKCLQTNKVKECDAGEEDMLCGMCPLEGFYIYFSFVS